MSKPVPNPNPQAVHRGRRGIGKGADRGRGTDGDPVEGRRCRLRTRDKYVLVDVSEPVGERGPSARGDGSEREETLWRVVVAVGFRVGQSPTRS